MKLGKKTAGDVLDRLQIVFGVGSDSQLCVTVGVPRATMGNWRSRDSVPYELCVRVAEAEGLSLDWLLRGEGPMKPGEVAPVTSANTPQEDAILSLYRALGDADRRDIQSAVEEKKRLRDIEQRLEELESQRPEQRLG
ncbi:helix-turn-helix transcriptional regulator [Pseudomonas sp. UC 17F4]|uniref:helix-turn-helix transcriptional regulator n=1 Tax=Pseudomonas sp. UC 17F4 TaxID=1855328 RepID=UPI000B8A118B|nr:helix-turn-helix transcriptional regulator [Pseudomonas sp. UC 17F4]